MRYISNIAAAAAIVSVAVAGDAPVAQSSNVDTSYSASIPAAANALSGTILGSVAPNGAGTNFQISFYNLPGTGNLSTSIRQLETLPSTNRSTQAMRSTLTGSATTTAAQLEPSSILMAVSPAPSAQPTRQPAK